MFCECPDANPLCCNGEHEASIEVNRNGLRLALCTRCNYETDIVIRCIDIGLDTLMEQDVLAWFIRMLKEED